MYVRVFAFFECVCVFLFFVCLLTGTSVWSMINGLVKKKKAQIDSQNLKY